MVTRQYGLTAEELSFYRTHGYLIREDVFSMDEIAALRDSVEAAVACAHRQAADGRTYFLDGKRFVDVGPMTVQYEHEAGSETVRVIEPVQHLDPGINALVRDPRVVNPIRDILGQEEIAVWTNKLNLKRAGEGSGFSWHQDSPYWVHDSGHVDLLPNVYVAFDDANLANGCLQVIDRSHVDGCLPGTSNGTQLGGFFTDPGCFSEADAVPLEVKAGSMAFFDAHIIHGSEPNRSDRPRRAIVMTYQPGGHPMLKTGEISNIG
jgi:ectoine hydroxylase-related dioxygenase (phytanoyl-CoA dioxygenase family)